ncbi:MAG TPA: fused MFS/spermidine synthase [Verrucomicrobiae bacterium]|nr:fused MFS/spermidine synthase [Verrucomicrobiae bacterium]
MKQKRVPAPEAPISRQLRIYLYFTAAITGAAIMVVEILGAKMLSPYVGLSHFVWIAQIAVTLVALSCGYYVGGRLADQAQRLSRLYGAILIAATYLAVTVLICEPVAYWALDFSLPVGSLMASTILFFVPLALLAMTGPFLVRVITSSIVGLGGNVGRLTSIGTVGSFLGTLCIGYIMVPLLPNSVTMYCTAGALLVLCAGYYFAFHRKGVVPLLVGMLLTSAVGFGLKPSHQYNWVKKIYEANSHFGRLQVYDRLDGHGRFYLNDFLIQNTYDTTSHRSESAFTYLLAGMARAYTTNIHDVLCIGLGVGIVPMDFARRNINVDVVEINPAVVPVAARFFDCETNLIRLTLDDARHYLNCTRKKYDVVVLDAFLGDSSPSHLFTQQAFNSMRRALRPGGNLVINCFGDLEEGRDYFAASLNKTLKSVFKAVHLHTSSHGAVFFAASDRTDPGFAHTPDFAGIYPQVLPEVESVFAGIADTPPDHGRVLTDDFNPVEFYDARNREEFRRRFALSAKNM